MLVPTQPQPSYVLASTDKKWEAPRPTRPPEPERAADAQFDVDDFYDNVPCTD